GAIIFHHIAQVIGEDKLHEVLKAYLEMYRYHPQHYPTTDDFMRILKARTDEDFHAMIDADFYGVGLPEK
ncbi:MAG: hypothetical protein AAFR59_06975, partial [Bacteroidota bacterium]